MCKECIDNNFRLGDTCVIDHAYRWIVEYSKDGVDNLMKMYFHFPTPKDLDRVYEYVLKNKFPEYYTKYLMYKLLQE